MRILPQSLILSLGASMVGLLLAAWGLVLAVLDVGSAKSSVILRLGDKMTVAATGSYLELSLFGGFLLSLLLINVFLVYQLEKRDWLWGKVLALVTLLMGALIFWAFQGIVSVN